MIETTILITRKRLKRTRLARLPLPFPSRLFTLTNTTSSIYGDISIYVSVVYMRWKIKIEVPDYSGSAHRFSVR